MLAARGSELEREFGFGVVRQLFEAIVADPAGGELLSGAAAPAGAVLGAPQDDDAAGASFAALHGLYWLVVNLAARRPGAALRRRPALERPGVAALRRLPGAPARGAARAGGVRPAQRRAARGSRPCWPRSSASRPWSPSVRRRSARTASRRCCGSGSGSSRARSSPPPCTAAPRATRCCCASSSPPWRTTPCRRTTRTPARSRRSAPVRCRAPSCCGSRASMPRRPTRRGPSPSSARARATRRSPS